MRRRVSSDGSRRSIGSLLAVAALLTMLVGCASGGGSAEPTSTPTPSPAPVLALKERFTTPLGNTVVVYAVDPAVPAGATPPPTGVRRVAADVEICAGAHPTERTGANPSLFFVETKDKIAYPAVSSVKKPVLEPTLLKANECARGWATFNLPAEATPLYVVLISGQQAKWRIP